MNHPTVLMLGPNRAAVSGVSTHLNLLMDSTLGEEYDIVHFQVGSEGRDEGAVGKIARLMVSPFFLAASIVFRHVAIVHINSSLNPRAYWRDLIYLFVSKMLGARVVYQVHGGELPRKFFAGSPVLTSFLRWTLGLPDVVVVLAQVELRAYREFLPDQNVVSLPNGIDCRPYGAVPTVRSDPTHPLQLVYIGRIAREKGLYETLQGLRLAHELGVDARLIVAGAGSEEPRLRRYAQALGIASRVCFVGPVFGNDKVKLLSGADVMVLPSYSEGLPYALLESMAAGVPVIATPVGAIPDVVSDGIHGFLVPPRDGKAIAEALAVLAGDREKLSWMSRACRRRIRAAFSIERLAQEFAFHYARLVGNVSLAGAGHARTAVKRGKSEPRRETPEKLKD
ncbi:MAG TPA: glycosyltransferase family 4 protein [Usitatibacter sp.]|nr:glycosyltransferase family 4 protein [Usitatibacter sp.]